MPTKKSATKKSVRVRKTPPPEEENDTQAEQPKKSASKKKSPKKVVRRVRQANTDVESKPAEGKKEEESKAPEKQKAHADRNDDGRKRDPRKDRDDRRRSGRGRNPGRGKPPRVEVDPNDLAKRAWKIYQADIAEEGIALVNNSIGRELAQRSFELARIFLEEEARHRRGTPEKEPAEPSPSESDEAE